jgi:hypothetical protein
MVMGRVVYLFICPKAGSRMEEVGYVNAIAGQGFEGDRYFFGRGAFSGSSHVTVRHATLIAAEVIAAANRGLVDAFLPSETRRNVVTQGVSLNDLVGVEFTVGRVRMRGVELCDPCDRPDKLAAKKGFRFAFDGGGGLRVEIVTSGTIEIDDEIEIV